MAKGSGYERAICKRLSLWWTQDEDPPRTDIFWRSTTSGARATGRAKKGLKTCNSYGDICTVDPVGQPLLDLVTIEVKRGYNKHSIQDLLDKGPKAAKQVYQGWIEKAVRDHEQADSFSWMVIVKRDKREPLALFPEELEDALPPLNKMIFNLPSVMMDIEIGYRDITVFVMPLENFLGMVQTGDILAVIRKMRRKVK